MLHVDHIRPSQVEFYYNSRHKNVSPMLHSVNYDENKSSSDVEASSEEETTTYNKNSTSEVEEFYSSIGEMLLTMN